MIFVLSLPGVHVKRLLSVWSPYSLSERSVHALWVTLSTTIIGYVILLTVLCEHIVTVYHTLLAMHILPGIALCTLNICPDNMNRRKCSQNLQVWVTVYVHLNLAVFFFTVLSSFHCLLFLLFFSSVHRMSFTALLLYLLFYCFIIMKFRCFIKYYTCYRNCLVNYVTK